MEEREGKGFVVKDRRKIHLDDISPSEQAPKTEERASEELGKARQRPVPSDKEQKQAPLPEVTFSTFIISLSSSALVHLGEIPDPSTNQTRIDLQMAKQIIDTLGMLEEKTKGNLEEGEIRLLRSILYDLRMRYVQKSG